MAFLASLLWRGSSDRRMASLIRDGVEHVLPAWGVSSFPSPFLSSHNFGMHHHSGVGSLDLVVSSC